MRGENGYPIPNAWLARHAKELNMPKKRLLVLAPNNDPFNAGTKPHPRHRGALQRILVRLVALLRGLAGYVLEPLLVGALCDVAPPDATLALGVGARGWLLTGGEGLDRGKIP